jgi:hypothetical protein
VMVGTYRETMQFDIIETSIYNVIFRLLWLEKHEPNIAYKARTIQFDKCSYNLETSAVKIFPVFLAAMTAYQRRDPNSVLFILIIVFAKELRAVKISFKYREFKYLFEEVKGKKALPEH